MKLRLVIAMLLCAQILGCGSGGGGGVVAASSQGKGLEADGVASEAQEKPAVIRFYMNGTLDGRKLAGIKMWLRLAPELRVPSAVEKSLLSRNDYLVPDGASYSYLVAAYVEGLVRFVGLTMTPFGTGEFFDLKVMTPADYVFKPSDVAITEAQVADFDSNNISNFTITYTFEQ